MDESPERTSLRNLTQAVVKELVAMNKLMQTGATPQRDKKLQRLLKELEVHNDEAMRVGLNLGAQQIARLKTGRSGPRAPRIGNSEPKLQTPFQQLMLHHARNVVGPIPDAGAQGAAIKWILESFTPELAIKKYNQQLEDSEHSTRPWRVSWLTVKRDIGRIQVNGTRPMDSADRNAERLNGNLDLIADLRGDPGRDYH